MKRVLKWVAMAVVVIGVAGFLAFLYFIPPFFSVSPEDYVKDTSVMTAPLGSIADPAERAIAERGKYIVMITGCSDCHTTPGPQGPLASMYLAGGSKFGVIGGGIAEARNLTPDQGTGIGLVKDDDIKRALRSGVFQDGRMMHHRQMPWNAFSNWTEEDRHAVLTYLRHIKPIVHSVPDPDRSVTFDDGGADHFYTADYGTPSATK